MPKKIDIKNLKVLNRDDVKAILYKIPIEGRILDDWWDKQKRDLTESLEANLKNGITRGETTGQLIERLRTAMEVSRTIASTLVQTATTHIEAKSSLESFEQSGITKGYTLDVTFDHRTSPICRQWDESKIYRYDDPKAPRPPFHFNCRTKVRPVIDYKAMGLEPLEGGRKKTVGALREPGEPGQGTRVRKTVPTGTNYEDWLRRQPVSFQEEVLGKSRAKLFRDGKANLAQMIRTDGRLLNLEQLRNKLGLE